MHLSNEPDSFAYKSNLEKLRGHKSVPVMSQKFDLLLVDSRLIVLNVFFYKL